MVTPVKSFGSSVARTLRSRRHFSSSCETANNETAKVGDLKPLSGILALAGGYFVAGPLFAGQILENNKEDGRKDWEEMYGESLDIDQLTPGIGESLWCLVGRPIWSYVKANVKANAARMWKKGTS